MICVTILALVIFSVKLINQFVQNCFTYFRIEKNSISDKVEERWTVVVRDLNEFRATTCRALEEITRSHAESMQQMAASIENLSVSVPLASKDILDASENVSNGAVHSASLLENASGNIYRAGETISNSVSFVSYSVLAVTLIPLFAALVSHVCTVLMRAPVVKLESWKGECLRISERIQGVLVPAVMFKYGPDKTISAWRKYTGYFGMLLATLSGLSLLWGDGQELVAWVRSKFYDPFDVMMSRHQVMFKKAGILVKGEIIEEEKYDLDVDEQEVDLGGLKELFPSVMEGEGQVVERTWPSFIKSLLTRNILFGLLTLGVVVTIISYFIHQKKKNCDEYEECKVEQIDEPVLLQESDLSRKIRRREELDAQYSDNNENFSKQRNKFNRSVTYEEPMTLDVIPTIQDDIPLQAVFSKAEDLIEDLDINYKPGTRYPAAFGIWIMGMKQSGFPNWFANYVNHGRIPDKNQKLKIEKQFAAWASQEKDMNGNNRYENEDYSIMEASVPIVTVKDNALLGEIQLLRDQIRIQGEEIARYKPQQILVSNKGGDNGNNLCHFGSKCRRKNCRFVHPPGKENQRRESTIITNLQNPIDLPLKSIVRVIGRTANGIEIPVCQGTNLFGKIWFWEHAINNPDIKAVKFINSSYSSDFVELNKLLVVKTSVGDNLLGYRHNTSMTSLSRNKTELAKGQQVWLASFDLQNGQAKTANGHIDMMNKDTVVYDFTTVDGDCGAPVMAGGSAGVIGIHIFGAASGNSCFKLNDDVSIRMNSATLLYEPKA